MPRARPPRRPCSRANHARATRRAHNGPSPAQYHRRSGRAFRLVPTPHRDGTTAPAARGPDALAARGLGPGSALDGLPPSPARQKFVPHDFMPRARLPRRPRHSDTAGLPRPDPDSDGIRVTLAHAAVHGLARPAATLSIDTPIRPSCMPRPSDPARTPRPFASPHRSRTRAHHDGGRDPAVHGPARSAVSRPDHGVRLFRSRRRT